MTQLRTQVSDSGVHTQLTHLYTQALGLTFTIQPWGIGVGLGKKRVGSTSHKPSPLTYHDPATFGGWGGAREEKGRVYQPQTFSLTVTGSREEKDRI